MINEKFRIDIFGDLDYEDLVADVYFEDKILVVLTQEEGFQNLRIRIYPPKDVEFWDFRFDEFEDIINRAKNRLWDLRKMPEDETPS